MGAFPIAGLSPLNFRKTYQPKHKRRPREVGNGGEIPRPTPPLPTSPDFAAGRSRNH